MEVAINRLLLISGYDASSHRYWRELIERQLPEYEWTQIALPDRYFYWRARGNALSLAQQHQDVLQQQYDLIIVTSMVDLSALRGFCPDLTAIPTIVYFHENQFAYPVDESSNLVNIQLLSIYSALCADMVVFNSAYNRDTFINGAKALLDRLPDEIPKGIPEKLAKKSTTLVVPLESDVTIKQRNLTLSEEPIILWNHRWEFDKQPEIFFGALTKLQQSNIRFKLYVLGQSFRKQPAIFDTIKESFQSELLTSGYQSRSRYLEILSQSDIVVSSSAHEFQGISMLEAIASGCMPIAPDRLVYPEYIPENLRYVPSEKIQKEAENLSQKLAEVIKSETRHVPDVSDYLCQNAIAGYQTLFEEMMSIR